MNRDLDYVLNYMVKYTQNRYMQDSEPMLNHRDIELVLKHIWELEVKIDKANRILKQILVISDKNYEGQYRPVKNTSRRDVYKTIVMLNEILETPERINYKILGDKENG